MMKRLRGRNLKHPGCLIGVTAGLIIGIIAAGIMAAVFNIAMDIDVWAWFGTMIVLGALGWIIGDRLSSRFPALEEERAEDSASEIPPS
ncbi:MAG TPA: hypothetical protein VHZ51_31170 [Ktedonobacteraceae bacterium]|jgi:hypothetical protein|nr:hypothetical protein [Ktedonobacteraceae bacterium]